MIEVAYDISFGNLYLKRLASERHRLAGAASRVGFRCFGPIHRRIFDQRRAGRTELWRTQIMADQILPKDTVMPWTDERVELLRKLWLEGLSASRIATELAGGVTRNAVIGKVHRLGLSGRVKTQATSSSSRMRSAKQGSAARTSLGQRPVAMPTRGNLALALQTHTMPSPQQRDAGDVVVPMTATVTIMDLRESMCRWPVGDPSSSDFRYCGGKAPIGEGPYCSFHSRMAYQPSQDRRHRKSA